jgi:hypothetical protein
MYRAERETYATLPGRDRRPAAPARSSPDTDGMQTL